MAHQLQIRMFGGLSLQSGAHVITDRDNRSRKVWHLLAYLITRRSRPVPAGELIEILWGNDPELDDPENTLKVTLHRARQMLDKLWPGAGKDLICRSADGCRWTGTDGMFLDTDVFEKACRRDDPDEERFLTGAMEALGLYRGEFLAGLSAHTWVIPIATHYHNLYINMLMRTVPLLLERNRTEDAAALCRAALPAEPYHEELHRCLMTALLRQNQSREAVAVYEELSRRLLHDFGITPDAQTRELYRQASHTVGDRTMPIDTVLDHLLEPDPAAGALLCSFEAFRVLCHAEARAMVRSGQATHVALLSVTGAGDRHLTRRSQETAMENLGQQIRLSLRRGDAFCKCSASQYVIMLPQANFENSCVVCRRIIGAFTRRYPHSPIRIHYMVRPLSTHNLESPKEEII